MKTVVLICVILPLLAQENLQDSDRYEMALECIDQVGIDRNIVEDAMATGKLKNDPKYKEFLACSYKKQGYQNEKGEILIENVKKFLEKFYTPTDLTALNICKGPNGPNHGENAFRTLKCIVSKLHNMTTTGEQ